MIDKIQSGLPAGYTNNINNQVESTRATTPVNNVRKVDNDSAEVSLSDDALAMQRIMQAVKEAPDVRVDIVQEIKGRIEAGNYQVNTEGLAEKLLPFMK